MTSLFALLGKTIEMVDAGDSLTIRFTDGTYLEVGSDYRYELNGDQVTHVEAWYQGHTLEGRAE